jgi:N6-L-threonylcarbamoyladenine synthase
MRILGIESSCDETSAAIVEDGTRLLSNVIHSQIDIHTAYGGVVPEVAARSHLEVILPVIDEAFSRANKTWDDIDALAVTYAPGLIGSLLVGTLTARTLAIIKHKPLYAIHHVEGHVYANFLVEPPPEFPMLALIASGLHCNLVLFHDHGKYELLGVTQDDAAGEAFDKVARLLGLPSPGGGLAIAKAAEHGDPHKYRLPIAKMKNPYDFSFSGLKTAVLRAAQAACGEDHNFPSFEVAERLTDQQRNDFAASFQNIAVRALVEKTMKAYEQYRPKSVVIAGGVAANQELRRQLKEALPSPITYAPMELCTDNAAMIASLGYYVAQYKEPTDPYQMETVPMMSMTKSAWR